MNRQQVSHAIRVAESATEGRRKARGDANRMTRCLEQWDGISEMVPVAGSREKQHRIVSAENIRAEAARIAQRYI